VCLAWPERLPLDLPRLDLVRAGRLDFEAPDRGRFPCLDLAWRALRGAETAPAVLNAANEVAVAAFLDERISFGTLPEVNRAVLDAHLAERAGEKLEDLGGVLRADEWARARAREHVEKQESRA
jgi:1-deoxy-D-xylulose-5-phosphate reductoisomerase